MAGIILISLGTLFLIAGLIVLNKSSRKLKPENYGAKLNNIIEMAISDGVLTNNEKDLIKREAQAMGLNYEQIINDVETQISDGNSNAETELINVNKRNGDDFEKFIAHKFNRKYFRIKEWAGDKYSKGLYAETTQHPDFLLEFNLKGESAQLSVECKWRSKYYKNGIEFSGIDQLQRYKEFEVSRKIPVFVAIGVGGKGAKPEHLYIIPLREIKSNFIPIEILRQFEKKLKSNFFYDSSIKLLR